MNEVEPILLLKGQVETQKKVVMRLQQSITEAKSSSAGWGRINGLKREWEASVNQLRDLKQKLRELSGTTGADPKWELIAKSHAVLSALDDAGIDIGSSGRVLLEEIEWHVPGAKLDAAAVSLVQSEGAIVEKAVR